MKAKRCTSLRSAAVMVVGFVLLIFSPQFSLLSQPDEEVQPADPTDKSWTRPRFTEYRQERARMVESQMIQRSPSIRDNRVLQAMRQVPRHLFGPWPLRGSAYDDHPLPIGHGQTISQPYIVALMTEALKINPGSKVLEIGTGSGYQAAVLSELTPSVYTMEIITPLGNEAEDRLHKLGYRTVEVRIGDGYFGWPEAGPFDGIIVTCAAGHIPPPLVSQLSEGGRMVIPVGGAYQVQRLMVLTKDDKGKVLTRELLPVRFVPMTGAIQQQG